MQRVAQIDLDGQLARMDLCGQLPQGGFVPVGRGAEGELLAELFGDAALVALRRLIV